MLNFKNNYQDSKLNNLKYSGSDELFNSEKYLKSYNNHIVSLLDQQSHGDISILDFGAGIGTLATLYYQKNKVLPECIEIDISLQKILKKRGFKLIHNTESINDIYDLIYSSNVLEHIPNDSDVIKDLYKMLKKNKYLALYLPAFSILYSDLDRSVGHYRRYDKRDISKKINEAGFQIIKIHYVDTLGFFIWLIYKIIGVKSFKNDRSGKTLDFFDRYLFPISYFFDVIGFRKLFGKSILIIAKKN